MGFSVLDAREVKRKGYLFCAVFDSRFSFVAPNIVRKRLLGRLYKGSSYPVTFIGKKNKTYKLRRSVNDLNTILCIFRGSLATTTSPQQQNTAKSIDLCEVRSAWR